MKKNSILYLFLFLTIASCLLLKNNNYYLGNWKEIELPFSDAIEFQEENDLLWYISENKLIADTEKYCWLRDKGNLWRTYSIINQIGLFNFISEESYKDTLWDDNYWGQDWNGMSLNDVVKKMINSFEQSNDSLDYFQKFWGRRKKEGNENVVFEIINEINNQYNKKQFTLFDYPFEDDTLYNLINYNVLLNKSDSNDREKISLEYFNYLKKMQLELSAYNLIFRLQSTDELKLNRDSLINTLDYDTISFEESDNSNEATWIRNFVDMSGP